MTQDLSEKVLQKIKEDKVHPRPRLYFVFRNYLIWMLGALAIITGGLAMSVVIFMIINNEWDLAMYVMDSRVRFLVATLPYAWIVLLVVFVILAEYQIRHTKRGYKISTIYLIAGILGFSVLFGGVFYVAGAGQIIDDACIKHLPYYKELGNRRGQVIMQPEKGIIGGLVVDVNGKIFEVKAIDNSVWVVDSEGAKLIGKVHFVPGKHVVVIGEIVQDNNVHAKYIKELRPGNGQRHFSPNEFEKIRHEMRIR